MQVFLFCRSCLTKFHNTKILLVLLQRDTIATLMSEHIVRSQFIFSLIISCIMKKILRALAWPKTALATIALVLISSVLVAQTIRTTTNAPANSGNGIDSLLYSKNGKVYVQPIGGSATLLKNTYDAGMVYGGNAFTKRVVTDPVYREFTDSHGELIRVPQDNVSEFVSTNGNTIKNYHSFDTTNDFNQKTIVTIGNKDFLVSEQNSSTTSDDVSAKNLLGWLSQTELLVATGAAIHPYGGVGILDATTGVYKELLPKHSYINLPVLSPSGRYFYYEVIVGPFDTENYKETETWVYDLQTKTTWKIIDKESFPLGWLSQEDIIKMKI